MLSLLTEYDEVDRDKVLETLMRGKVSAALNIPAHVRWGSLSGKTFTTLAGDFMKPAIHMGTCNYFQNG